MIATSNTTALQILRGREANSNATSWRDSKADWMRPPNHGVWFGTGLPGPVEPISDITKDAIARIVAIVGEGGAVDLSGTSYTHSSISAKNNATIIGGDGNDSIDAQNYAIVFGSGGSDSIGIWDYGKVDGGAGDDFIAAGNNAEISAGDGDDWVTTHYSGKVDLGSGDDYLYGYAYTQVDGGSGKDEIRVGSHSTVDGGEGGDLIVTMGQSFINGGPGNDIIVALGSYDDYDSDGYNIIDGGEGDDYIQTADNSKVSGGAGNDMIRLMGAGSTVSFAKGDGQDAILSRDDFTLKIGGYTKEDVSVTTRGEDLIVSFAGSEDSITLTLSKGATAQLTFDDGSSLHVTGSDTAKNMPYLWTRPSWAREEAYHVIGYV